MKETEKKHGVRTAAAVLGSLLAPQLPGCAEGGVTETSLQPPTLVAHWPTRVDPTGRHFQSSDGRAFFWLGDTAWLLAQASTREDADLFLETRADQGFSVIQMAAVNAERRAFAGVLVPNAYGDSAFIAGDPARPRTTPGADPDDPAEYDYWDHLDYLVDKAEAEGLVAAMFPMFVGYQNNGFESLTTANAYQYGAFLGERYGRRPNVLWVLCGDNNPETAEKRTIWNLMAKGITEGVAGSEDYSRTLMTCHVQNRHSSAMWFHNAPWLDFNMRQVWATFEFIHPDLMLDYARTPAKPTGLGEGSYEHGVRYSTHNGGFEIHAPAIRKQAYWSYLSGGYHTYGNTNTWNLGVWTPGVTEPWKQALFSEGATHLTVLRDFFDSFDWWKLVPDPTTFVSGEGGRYRRNVAARSSDGDRIVVYLTSDRNVVLDLTRITASDTVEATWVSPVTGERTVIGRYPNEGSRTFTPPTGWEDALLMLEAA
jgi:hypothetical protein